jgi:hypothetical protein
MSGPDNENQHHWRERDLEEELEACEEIIDRMNNEILELRISTRRQLEAEIASVENRQEYVDAKNERDRIAVRLMEHREQHGSYRRVTPDNLLDDEQIRMREEARRARQRGERAPGGSARRQRRSSFTTSPVTTPETSMRFATIGGSSAFTTPPRRSAFTAPPRSDSGRSSNQEPSNTRTSPIQTPNRPRGTQSSRRYQRRATNYSTNRISPPPLDDDGLIRSPSDSGLDGRRPGNRNTRSADGTRPSRPAQFKPTLKF